MFELLIDKQIGEDFFTEGITAEKVRESLASVQDGEEVRITVDSPGGDAWECVSIFNVIREFVRNHQNVSVTTYIRGLAASAASIIALAAHSVSEKNKIVVESNSIYMIHNAQTIAIGDKSDLREAADLSEKFDNMMTAIYTQKTGKSDKEIKKLMDATTFFFGQEILDAGFADEIISDKNENGGNENLALKNDFVMKAQARVIETENLMSKNAEKIKKSNAKIAAMLTDFKMQIPGGKKSEPDNKITPAGDKMEGCNMTVEELKKNNPEVYEAIVSEGRSEGEKSGMEKERARASSLLKMGELAGCLEVSADFIRNGAAVADNEVQETFFERRIAKDILAKQAEDEKDIPNIVPPKAEGGRDNSKVMAAFEKDFGIKGE